MDVALSWAGVGDGARGGPGRTDVPGTRRWPCGSVRRPTDLSSPTGTSRQTLVDLPESRMSVSWWQCTPRDLIRSRFQFWNESPPGWNPLPDISRLSGNYYQSARENR